LDENTKARLTAPADMTPDAMLRRALAAPHMELYHTSPSFKTGVDALARMLPLWIDGLAAHAREMDFRHNAAMESLLGFPLLADPSMRPGAVEFRDGQGNVIGGFDWGGDER